jgi:hypothetical protein
VTDTTDDPRRRPKPAGAAAPALVVRLKLENRPRVIVEARDKEEKDRFFDWLCAQHDLAELALPALDAEIREQAA